MLEGINTNFQIQNIQNNKLAKLPERNQNAITAPIDKYTMAGLESLGVYNMSLVKNRENFDHKPAELIVAEDTKMSDIDGDKVFDPYGKLEYIIQNDGKYETRYYAQDENPEMVGRVEIKDIYNGKLIKEQENMDFIKRVRITEYSPDEPNITYNTGYDNGRPEYIKKVEKMPDGTEKVYSKNCATTNPELDILLRDKKYKNSIYVAFDSQNILKNINIQKTIGNTELSKSIDLNKGAVVGINEYKQTVVPNFMEREVLNDNDVLPTEKFDREKLETMAKNSPSNVYSFYGNGNLKEINDKNIKIEFNEDGSQCIKEYLDNDITKTTSYKEDGSIDVIYKNGDTTKSLEISSDNKPVYYNIAKGDKCLRSAYFSDEGYLRCSTN